MKKYLRSFLSGLALSLVVAFTYTASYANHIRGCDLRYTWVSGNTYHVVLTVYGDCSVTLPSLTTSRPVICTFNGGTFSRSDTLTIESPSTGTNVSQVCLADTGLTTCSAGGTIPGTKRYVYSKNITVSGTSHYWRFIFSGNMAGSSAGRASSISNITPVGSTIIQLVDSLDNTYHNNSSPSLDAIATPYFCINNPNNYSPIATDPNGDSLHFSLVAAINNSSATCSGTSTAGAVTYTSGSSATVPIISPSAFSFDPLSGQISFSTSTIQNSLVVYNIEEYRNDTFIGTSQREMTFIVQTCTEPPPTAMITGVTNGVAVDSTHFQICQNTGAFQFNLNPVESDTTYQIYVSASNIPSGATFTVSSDSTSHPTGVFSWTSATTPGTYIFYVTYQDNACPIAGRNVVAYTVTINPPPAPITGTMSVCAGSTTTLSDATTGGSWSFSNGNGSIGASTGVVTGVSPGLDTVTYSYSPANCIATAVVTVNQAPTPITGTMNVCVGQTTALSSTPTGGTWTSSATLIATVGSTGVVTGASSGVTNISYTLSDGCAVGAPVTVNALPTPITGTLGICVGATTTLNSTPVGGTWVSTNPTVATLDPVTGVATGVAVGVTTIIYTVGSGCFVSANLTVNATPAAITPSGPVTVCVGTIIALGESVGGGLWSSSAPGVASVGSSGVVTGISAGTANITYAIGSCFVTKAVTVIATPAPISPLASSVCTGATETLTDATPGGTWFSSNPAVVSVGSSSGVVSGLAVGVAAVTYIAAGGCYTLGVVTVNLSPAAITPSGSVSVCVGSSTSLADATPGGIWSSGATGVATVGTGGSVTGVSAGVVTISYTLGTCPATKQVTVLPLPSPISPSSSSICTGATATLTDVTTGGTWSSGASGIVSVAGSTGTITGVSAGAATITYTVGSCFVTATVTDNANPAAITPPTPVSICVGATAVLGDASPGGTWSSGSTAIATVGTGGVVTGVSSGVATISYTNAAGCSATKLITVAVTPSAISPLTSAVCIGSADPLTNAVSGGTWTSASTSVATVGSSSGIVTGVAAGSTTITYTIGSCFTTATVSVSAAASPGTISGGSNVCVGSTLTLTGGATGGAWSSSNTSIATVGSTGIVTAVSAGVATISYSVSNICGTVAATHTVNVLAPGVQPISGLSVLCAGTFTTYTDATVGGTWSVTNANATITGTGLLTGISAGNDTIRYNVTNVCGTYSTTKAITIGPYLTAGTITGASSLCVGSTITLSDLAPGGTWSTSNGSASVGGTGVVTGVAGGVDTVMYTTTSSCGSAVATHVVTVNPLPNAGAIVGSAIICAGMVVPYSDTATGGVWSMTNTSLATVGSATGVVTAISTGADTIKYTVTNVCGTAVATKPITIGAFLTAGTISGPASVCQGSTITLTDPAAGGVWSSSSTSIATVGTGGIVTGVGVGVDTVLYTVTSACGSVSASHVVTVNPLPDAGTIAGSSNICTGSVTTYTDAAGGGTWSLSNGHATVTGGGVVTAVTTGVDTLKYTVTNGCGTASSTLAITIGSIASAGTITGPANVCIGSAITLTDGAGGGVWSSSSAVATVGSSSGIVTGIASGSATITYTVSGSCGTAMATAGVTVSPVPVAGTISGPSNLCVGTFTIYTDGSLGGVWSAINGNATITSGGVATGITAGPDTILYTVTTGCGSASASKPISILPSAGAGTITGPSTVCVGSAVTLTDGVSGGVWSASNSTAAVGSTGIVTGMSAGIDTVLYTVTTSCGTAVATHVVSVAAGTGVSAISGPSTVCVGALITLTDATPGGAWGASNPHATITTSGVVTGITSGVDTIVYSVSSACGTGIAMKFVTVDLSPSVSPISGSATVCQGASTLMTDATSGGVWSTVNSHASIGSSTGIITGISAGADTVVYTVTSACGSVSAFANITVNPLPDPGVISGPDSVCAGSSITLSDPAPGGVWSAGNANATVSGGIVVGVSAGTDPISYSVTNSCGTASAVQIVNVIGLPVAGSITGSSNVCVGSGITLLDAAPGGTWLAANANAFVAAPGVIEGATVGIDTIFYVVSNVCGVATTSKVINVNPVPFVAPISGPTMQCTGTTTVYTNTVGGGVWSSSTPAVATIGVLSGVATGVSIGTTTITYTVTNAFGCPGTVTTIDTVIAVPVVPAITGSSNACVGATTALADSVSGGIWSSSNLSIATIDAGTGVLTGIAAGPVSISYTVINMCGTTVVTRTETVNPLPVVAGITGTTHQCQGATSTLSDATTGGIWISGTPSIASVDSISGVVTGMSAGTTNINYLFTSPVGCTAIVVTADTVLASPVVAAIGGTLSECVGATATATDATAGGVWSSSNPAVATIGAGTGIITGIAAGTAMINYSVTNILGCTTTVNAPNVVNDVPVVAAIMGGANACVGGTLTLSDTTTGGVWTAANGNATVTGGVVTGVSAGADTIIYSVSNVCGTSSASRPITVQVTPTTAGVITGPSAVCNSASITLADTISGGVWTASNAHATVSSTGVVTGASAGVDTIKYTVSNACGSVSASKTILVNQAAYPGVISGGTSVCAGLTMALSDIGGATGGAWSSSNTALATVFAGGVVTGLNTGTVNISYTVSNGCGTRSATHTVIVVPASDCRTGVTGTNASDDIRLYPNPASTLLQVDAPVSVNVTVLSVDGKVLIRQNDATSIDVTGLADGMYIVLVYDANNVLLKTAKFAKAQ